MNLLTTSLSLCRQRGRESENSQNFVDIIYEWPLHMTSRLVLRQMFGHPSLHTSLVIAKDNPMAFLCLPPPSKSTHMMHGIFPGELRAAFL